MAEKDVALKIWLKNKGRFADFFNGVIFDGEQVVKPEELELTDSESGIVLEDKSKQKMTISRRRDVIMRWRGQYNLVILAVENQTKISHVMPARTMLYDALSYDEQMKVIHQEKRQKYNIKGDYLSTFCKKDKLYPVISIVFYYGEKPWNSNKELFDMFKGIKDSFFRKKLERYVSNYKINIVDVTDITHIENFNIDLQMVLGMLKYRQDKEALAGYVNQFRNYFENLEKDTTDVVAYLIGLDKIDGYNPDVEEGERVDMCKAIRDMINDSKQEGREEGRAANTRSVIKNMLDRGFSVADICAIAECSEEDVEKVRMA